MRNAEAKQLDLAREDDGQSMRWFIANAGDTGIRKSYVTIQSVTSGKYITAPPERSGNIGLDSKAFKDDTGDSHSLWQLLQLVTAAGPLTAWIEQVEEPSAVADTYT